jgi:succinate dehydrogenase/fumarate reductase cytochrome b subunit
MRDATGQSILGANEQRVVRYQGAEPMKALETWLFALSLLTVPALAWICGRAMGRRDWPILAVIPASCLVTLFPHLSRLVILAVADGRPLPTALTDLLQRATAAPEIGFFFLALGVFMTMLGWTSTPVATSAE